VATTIKSIIVQVRAQLVETVARYWSDPELISIMRLGAQDMWGAILDLHQDYYFKINDTDVVLKANSAFISGIPADCFRVTLIEPRDTSVTGTGHQVLFVPRKYNHPDFIVARTLTPQDPTSLPSRQIYYQLVGLGPPSEPMRIVTAPQINSNLPIRLTYNQTIWPDSDNAPELNPLPGECDNALKAWTIAYARAKETDGRTPDPGWLSVYATEKQMVLVRLTPREEQEPEVVEDMFQGYGSMW
jgi:hypothetical protein